MAIQNGLFKISGNLDGVTFYKQKGIHYAKKTGGLSKAKIQNDPKYGRVRENMSEFSGTAKACRTVRHALKPVSNFQDSSLQNRLMKTLRVVLKQSPGIRGQRPVQISQQQYVLKDVKVNEEFDFAEIFSAPYTATHSANRTSVTLDAQNIDLAQMVQATQKATQFRLVQLIGVIPDTVYVDADTGYASVNPLFDGLSATAYSAYCDLNSQQPLNITLTTALVNPPALPNNVSVIQGLGIIFYEQVGNAYYPLNQNMAFKIVDVF